MRSLTRGSLNHTLAVLFIVLVLAVALVPLVPQTAYAAATWYVDVSVGADSPGRGGAANPLKSISYAMLRANQGDTIMVKPGTYRAATGETFPIGFKPRVRLISTDGAEQTTIKGNGSGPVIYMVNATAGSRVEGFTITGGGSATGGGIRIDWLGPGSAPGWPVIAENTIEGNYAPAGFGGGIYIFSSGSPITPVIRDNFIMSNAAVLGAGIFCGVSAAPMISGNFFYGNIASDAGGGLYASALSDPSIQDSWFIGNGATGVSGGGGAIAFVLQAGTACDVRRCYFGQNGTSSGGSGGAIINAVPSTTVRVYDSEFIGNSSSADGGAFYMNAGSATFTNCVMSGNQAVNTGAAVYVNTGAAQLTNCTIWGNRPGAAGVVGTAAGPIGATNCIVGDHTGNHDLYYTSVANSLVQQTNFAGHNNTIGAGVIHGDPRFVSAATYDFHLRASSPCVDTGTSVGAPAGDIDGLARPLDGDGDGTAWDDMGAHEHPVPDVTRYAGSDRYQTAVDIVSANFDEADTVVIASGEGFADALSAAGLAGSHGAPLLLVRPGEVPQAVLSAIAQLGAGDAIIVGGTAAVSDTVKGRLEAAGLDVTRVWGANRYETSENVAREIAAVYDGDLGTVFVARGDAFPDALAVSPVAYRGGYPILLTESSRLPDPIEDLLADFDVSSAFMCGGTAAVSTGVESRVRTLIQPGVFDQVGRWAGADRYATAAAIAQGAIDEQYADPWNYVGIATGENFPDALAGGIAAGQREGLVLLTQRDSLPDATRGVLVAQKDVLQFVEVYGGTGAVSSAVEAAIESALGW